jgi:hypothetical protein
MARKHVQPGFFDLDERYAALSEAGDPLERLGAVIDFEPFPIGWRRLCSDRTARRAAGLPMTL